MPNNHKLAAAIGALLSFGGIAQAQGSLTYYFAHIASAGVWRTTFTYVNQTTQAVTCNTSLYSDSGAALPLPFNKVLLTSTSDAIPPGGIARRQTDAESQQATVTGWATASCTGPVKASALFRSYNGSVAQAEASVPAMTYPTTEFVTYADQSTGVAYANPSESAAAVSFLAKDQNGAVIGTASISLSAGAHGSSNLGPLLGLASFQGSITISSSQPIVSLSLNAEASPVISSLPPGQPYGAPATGSAVYYFPHIATNSVWRTTFTYVNASTAAVTCTTSFYSDSGSPLALSFGGVAISSTTDNIPAGGLARRQTDLLSALASATGWAKANCTGPVMASALFREYSGSVAQGEASMTASTAPASQFRDLRGPEHGGRAREPVGKCGGSQLHGEERGWIGDRDRQYDVECESAHRGEPRTAVGHREFSGFSRDYLTSADRESIVERGSVPEFFVPTSRRRSAVSSLWSLAMRQRRLQLGDGAQHHRIRRQQSLDDRSRRRVGIAFVKPGGSELCATDETAQSHHRFSDRERCPDRDECSHRELFHEPRHSRHAVHRRSDLCFGAWQA
jgi:hypothetical protein